MKKNEFISELKEALEHNMDTQKIKEQVEYYEDYIRSEVQNGRLEEDVVNELGDPWAIAKTIRLSEGMGGQETVLTQEESHDTESNFNWKTIVIIVVLAVLAISVLSLAMGLLGLVFRYAIPIVIIVILIQILKRR